MNYKRFTEELLVNKLRDIPARRASIVNIPEQIKMLEEMFIAIKAAKTDGDPVSGGGNHREDALIDNIVKRQWLQIRLKSDRAELEFMERNLAALPPNERLVLERFYINGEKHAAERLSQELGYEQAQIYRIKDAAIKSLADRIYAPDDI